MNFKKIYIGRKRFRDFHNMAHISLTNKYLYSAVSKVANSSIKSCLYRLEYREIWKENLVTKKSVRDKRLAPTLSPFQLPNSLLEEVFTSSDYFRFSFVRNPYSRILSCFLDRIADKKSAASREIQALTGKENVTFSEFCKVICAQNSKDQNDHWRRQYDDILFGVIDYNFIGRFENLEEDMKIVSENIFGEVLPEMILSPGNNYSPSETNSHNKLKKYYTKELQNMVYESYKDDFECFSYSYYI